MNQPGCLKKGLLILIMLTSFSLGLFYLLFNTGTYKPPDAPDQALIIHQVRVFDGNDSLSGPQTVVIEGQEIQCISNCALPDPALHLDGGGKILIPGLIDLHVHFFAPSLESKSLSKWGQFPAYVRLRPQVRRNLHKAGVTAMRGLGDITENSLSLEQQLRSGEKAGPRFWGAGPVFTAPGGHPAATIFQNNAQLIEQACRIVSDSLAAKQGVADLAEKGIRGIKAVLDGMDGKVNRLDEQVLAAIISEADRHNMWVAVHTGTNADIQAALALGVQSIEHGSREPLDQETLLTLKNSGAFYIPMLAYFEANEAEYLEVATNNVVLLDSIGGRIGLGSDTQQEMEFGSSLHREMVLMAKAGIEPLNILRYATQSGATCLRQNDKIGYIKAGMLADCVLLDEALLEDIHHIQQPDMVIQDGRIVWKTDSTLFRDQFVNQ